MKGKGPVGWLVAVTTAATVLTGCAHNSTTQVSSLCGTKAVYTATSSNTFNTQQDYHDTSTVKDQLYKQTCTNPELLAVLEDSAKYATKSGDTVNVAQTMAMTRSYAASQSKWASAYNDFWHGKKPTDVAKVTVKWDGTAKYQTLGAVRRPNGEPPELIRATMYVKVEWTAVLHLRDGRRVILRIICGFQPVAGVLVGVPPGHIGSPPPGPQPQPTVSTTPPCGSSCHTAPGCTGNSCHTSPSCSGGSSCSTPTPVCTSNCGGGGCTSNCGGCSSNCSSSPSPSPTCPLANCEGNGATQTATADPQPSTSESTAPAPAPSSQPAEPTTPPSSVQPMPTPTGTVPPPP